MNEYEFFLVYFRDKAARSALYIETPAVILKDTKECGILKCRPSFIQKYAGIKVLCIYAVPSEVFNIGQFSSSVLFSCYRSL